MVDLIMRVLFFVGCLFCSTIIALFGVWAGLTLLVGICDTIVELQRSNPFQ
jgi:hypothetical protein